jgi:hypothetical protein
LPLCCFSQSVQEADFYTLCHSKRFICGKKDRCPKRKTGCKYSHDKKEQNRYQLLRSTEHFTMSKLQLCLDMQHQECYHDPCRYSHSEQERAFAALLLENLRYSEQGR